MPRSSAIVAAVVLASLAAMAQEAEQTQPDAPEVLESVICAGVEDRQPVAAADTFAADVDRIYCWTRIGQGAGTSVVHAWIHDGVTRARVELAVGSDDWRTYSSKRILPAWTGDWEVKVLTPGGAVLATIPFYVR